MGALSPNDQQYLAENMIAFFRRDYRQVAQLHIDSGWVDPNTRIEEFEATIRTVCEPIFERPLSEISFGHLLAKLFRTAKRFNMEVQPQLLLLQKTLLNVESLGRRLYPELNLWRTAKPFLEKWISQQRGMRYVYHQAYHRGPYWLKQFADMPDMLYRYLSQSQALVQQRYTANMHQNLTEKSLKGGRHKPVATILGASGLALLAYGILDRGVDLHWQLPKGDWALIAAGGLLIAGLLTKLKS